VSDREELFGAIESHLATSIDRLVELATIPSVSATDSGIRQCAEALLQTMEPLGIEASLLETGGAPIVYGHTGTGRPRVLVYGHYDVQPAGDRALWTHPPFEPVIRDGAIWGRGVGDNKGQLLAHLCALDAWRATLGELPFEVVFVFDGEEEIGSPSTLPFIAENAELFEGDFVFGADGSTLGLPGPAVYLGVRGLVYLELVAHAAPYEWHSGSYGGVLPNAIQELASALAALVDLDGTVRIDGFYDDVAEPSEEERELARSLPREFLADPGEFGYRSFRVDDPRTAMFFRPQFGVCGFDGGYTGDGVKTAVPTGARAKVDITLVPNQDPERICSLVRAHLDASGFADVELVTLARCPPIASELADPFVQKAVAASTAVWGKAPFLVPSIGGGGPLAAFVETHGMPALMIPYAQADLNEHSTQEHLELAWFENGIKTSAELFRLIAEEAA
jgi:acetylornithine deacetylase/succinyl-diaminopimelate desuccinylase-like protein